MMMKILISFENNNWMTLRISIGQISMTAIENQYCRIRWWIRHVHGPATIKLAHCFRLAMQFIICILFQDFIKHLCQQNYTTIQQCKYCKFFKGARILVNKNVFFCFTATTASTCINTSGSLCNVNEPNALSVSDLTPVNQIQCQCIIVTSTP